MILDYGVVVVHIFQPECRAHYDIESLWDSGTLVYQDEPDAAFTGFA
jgi:ribosomal silencing factor RsfS